MPVGAGRSAAFLVGCVLVGVYFASQAVYFVGTDEPDGFVTVFRGLPYELPAGMRPLLGELRLRRPRRVAGRARSATRLLDHKLRSQRDAQRPRAPLELGRARSQ